MPTPTRKRGRPKEERRSGARKKTSSPMLGKEVNYVLQLSATDTELLKRYQGVLAQGAAGFAETS